MSDVEIFIGSDGIARRAPKYRMTVYGESADDLLRTEQLFAAHETIAALCQTIVDASKGGGTPSAEDWATIVSTANDLIGDGVVPPDIALPEKATEEPAREEPKEKPKGIGVADPMDFELVDEDEVGDMGDLDFDSDEDSLEPDTTAPEPVSQDSLDAIASSVLQAAGEPDAEAPRLSPIRHQPTTPSAAAPEPETVVSEDTSEDEQPLDLSDDLEIVDDEIEAEGVDLALDDAADDLMEEIPAEEVLGEEDVLDLSEDDETSEGATDDSATDAATLAQQALDETNRIEWRDEYSVGSAAMDKDHKVLIDLINQIAPAMNSGDEAMTVVGSVLKALWDYTGYHFSREETLHGLAEFPESEPHKAKHEALKETVRKQLEAFATDPTSVDVGEVLDFLRTWLVQHILKEDMHYKPYVTDRPDLEEAVDAVNFLDMFDDDEEEDIDLMAQLSEAELGDTIGDKE